MSDDVILDTTVGRVTLRGERAEDADFLYALFRSHMWAGMEAMAVDDAMKESLVRMQFRSQTMTYRTQYKGARFDVLERDGVAFGRLVVHEDAGVATVVDVALLPESRGAGVGTAVMERVLAWVGERCEIVRLSVLWHNEASLRMMLRLGFVQVGETPPHLDLEWRRPAG